MNTFINELQNINNFDLTENGAIKHKTTKSYVLDMFGLGGAYRNRRIEDCILLFKNAFEEDKILAMKCLFYLRDCRGGQGERRFFRICFKWLAENYPTIANNNLEKIPEFGRWDDVIYATEGTQLERRAFHFIKEQLALDCTCTTPSLLAKWLPSINASSFNTKRLANKIRTYLNLSEKDYRKILSALREKIKVLEKLMSENRWDEIEFDKIPSKAGLIYKNAFARKDFLTERYKAFAKSKTTKVNAKVLNPVDIAKQVFGFVKNYSGNDVDRLMLQKYWNNLKDYYDGRKENGIAIVDVSGSMFGTPLAAAVSMGAYIAERGKGPFANHFITFSEKPALIKFEGVDIVDKFQRAKDADWGRNTNIEAVFEMLLNTAKNDRVKNEDMPETLYIFSDMEFDNCIVDNKINSSNKHYYYEPPLNRNNLDTLLERISKKWEIEGYKLPRVIFWNLDARSNNIPALGERFSYVSGFSMNMVETILSGKDGYDLMTEKLLSERYSSISI